MSDLDVLLNVSNILEVVEQFKPADQALPYTRYFMAGRQERIDGDNYKFEKYTNARDLAGWRGRNSEGRVNQRPNRKFVEGNVLHVREKEILFVDDLFLRSAPGGDIMKSNARETVAFAIKRLVGRLYRQFEYASARLLQDAAGVVLGSANVNYPAAASTIGGNLTIEGGLSALAMGAPWTTAGTRMLSDTAANQIPAIASTMEANGFVPYHFLHSRATAASVAGNTEAQTWLTTNGGLTIDIIKQSLRGIGDPQAKAGADIFQGGILNGLGGIDRWTLLDHVYTNRAAAVTRYTTATQAVVLPKELDEVIGWVDAPAFVPNLNLVIGDASNAAEMFNSRRGLCVWAKHGLTDSPSVEIIAEWHGCPVVFDNLGILSVTGL